MLIYAIDDEPKLLRLLHDAIAQASPEAEIADFPLGSEAVAALQAGGARPDVVFTDIQMPGLTGLGLAEQLKRLAPDAQIVFVTGFSQYALEAYRLHARGYLMKPVNADMIREELAHLPFPQTPAPPPDKLAVRCFGHFEVFWQGRPLIFQRKQTKELLALLIDHQGAACGSREVVAALWEDEEDSLALRSRVRVLINDLRNTLREIGMEEVLIREHRQLAIRRDLVDCDYYRMLSGDVEAINSYRGEYMKDYSWAEMTAARLHFWEE